MPGGSGGGGPRTATAVVVGPHYPGPVSTPTIGVFALQGDVREHLHAVSALGAEPLPVRRPEELARVDGLILPGGESTTMIKLADAFDMTEPFTHAIRDGLPVFGTCAGMIMLADRLRDGAPGQRTFGGLDATVRRNAFGRQVDSFESWVPFTTFAEPVHAVFIRAPWIEEVGPDVEVLASVHVDGPAAPDGEAAHQGSDRIVAVRHGRLLATSFHPEVGDDLRLHRLFLDLVTS